MSDQPPQEDDLIFCRTTGDAVRVELYDHDAIIGPRQRTEEP